MSLRGIGIVDPARPINWAHPLARGLVGFWKIVPNSGWRGGSTLRDLVHGIRFAHHGTLTATPTWNDGMGCPGSYGSLTLNGTTQYVDVGNVDSSVAKMISVSAWIRSTSASGAQPVAVKNFDGVNKLPFALNLGGSAAASYDGFAFYDGSWHKSGITTDLRGTSAWHHVVGTWDGATLSYYIDGKLDASVGGLAANNRGSTSTTTRIGNYQNDSVFFPGQIDCVAIHSVVLSLSRVNGLYLQTKAGCPDLLNWLGKQQYWSTQAGADNQAWLWVA